MSERNVMLRVDNLKQYFHIDRKTTVKAVDGVSFEVYEGETFSIVGESGSGKSTLGRALIRIYDPQGDVTFMGQRITGKLNNHEQRHLRKNMQMIFQDPMASLNPRKKILDTVAYGLDIHKETKSDQERKQRVKEVLEKVGLSEEFMTRYPHQFSGGQRQRIGVARAIILEPKFIICDEIISALDVSIQAQVINLMRKLQREQKLTYLFIAHDLSMVRSISDRVAVMHLGHIVEMGTVSDIYDNPIHPYTKALLSAIPHPDPIREKKRKRVRYIKGAIDYNAGETVQLSETHRVLGTPEDIKDWECGDYSESLQPIVE
ncbi:peptide ABC transporter ATP-binding protein [Erysipelothrix larvae]|uniref:Peptide ABC transporter ATP-binding protein n=1 Tax=Erysipelothrix larvae TaxID=1514105 RepID=A0A109UGF4_9FIRM|nr:oligopeptide/dipeptide ABC transporter ATP-binding protein [Erysipelothrix larvae]AMC92623.1 peptide ABC transporter ATP-binding protein [Erysipelothrix larvae]